VIVLKIAGIVLLSLILLIVLLLSLPVFGRFKYDGELYLSLRVLFCSFAILPEDAWENPKGVVQKRLIAYLKKKQSEKDKPKKTPKKRKKKQKEQQEEEKKSGGRLSELFHIRGLSGVAVLLTHIFRIAVGTFRNCLRGVRIKILVCDLSVSGEDSADTAVQYGRYCAAIYPALSIMSRIMSINLEKFNMYPNFNSEETELKADVKFTLFPIAVVFWLAAAFIRLVYAEVVRAVRERMDSSQADSQKEEKTK
jgi:hypothetical protein